MGLSDKVRKLVLDTIKHCDSKIIKKIGEELHYMEKLNLVGTRRFSYSCIKFIDVDIIWYSRWGI